MSDAVPATLNAERVVAGMTFDQLAAATGITAHTLLRYLSSKTERRAMKLDDAERIAAALGLSLGDVIRLAEDRQARQSAVDVSTPKPWRTEPTPADPRSI